MPKTAIMPIHAKAKKKKKVCVVYIMHMSNVFCIII